MRDDLSIGEVEKKSAFQKVRKAGRPHAIPDTLTSTVVLLYRHGNGYRAISRILDSDYGVIADYSSVRRTLQRAGEIRWAPFSTMGKPSRPREPVGGVPIFNDAAPIKSCAGDVFVLRDAERVGVEPPIGYQPETVVMP